MLVCLPCGIDLLPTVYGWAHARPARWAHAAVPVSALWRHDETVSFLRHVSVPVLDAGFPDTRRLHEPLTVGEYERGADGVGIARSVSQLLSDTYGHRDTHPERHIDPQLQSFFDAFHADAIEHGHTDQLARAADQHDESASD